MGKHGNHKGYRNRRHRDVKLLKTGQEHHDERNHETEFSRDWGAQNDRSLNAEIQDSKEAMERSGGGSIIPGGMAAFNEEIGADFSYGMPPVTNNDSGQSLAGQVSESRSSATGIGWLALVFAIASWIIWPVPMGAASVVLGFIAYSQGARGLGSWSIALGFIAIVIRLIVGPLLMG